MSFEKALKSKFGTKYRKTTGAHGAEYRINCPFCPRKGKSPDKKYKLYINPTRKGGVYQCFRCGSAGTTQGLIGYAAALAEKPVKQEKAKSSGYVRMPGTLVPLSELEENHPAIQYLTKGRSRYFDPEFLSKYHSVAYCQDGVKFGDGESFLYNTTGTLIFPIFKDGMLAGWQSRMMTEPEDLTDGYLELFGYPKDEDGDWIRPPKYFTSPGFPKGELLYNFDMARAREPVVVTEGVFDALAVGPSGVALLGKGITDVQTRILQTYCNTVVILLDPDAGHESKELVKVLKRSINAYEVTLDGYKDPGDAPTEEIWRQIMHHISDKK